MSSFFKVTGGDVKVFQSGMKFTFLGASFPVGLTPGETATDVSVKLPEGYDEGIFAVRIFRGSNAGFKSFLIPVRRAERGIVVEKDLFFDSHSDRVGDVTEEGSIRCRIGNILYSSTEIRNCPEDYRVVDPNLLCKYLVGIVDASAINAQAEAIVREKAARKRLPEVEAELAQVKTELAEKRDSLQRYSEALDDTLEKIHELKRRLRRNQLGFEAERVRMVRYIQKIKDGINSIADGLGFLSWGIKSQEKLHDFANNISVSENARQYNPDKG